LRHLRTKRFGNALNHAILASFIRTLQSGSKRKAIGRAMTLNHATAQTEQHCTVITPMINPIFDTH
jgi:hypothetical protein